METEIDTTDYPAFFRAALVRGTTATLAAINLAAPRLDEDLRERSLYLLSLALELPEAWASARDLTFAIALQMEIQGYRREWMDFLVRALAEAEAAGDTSALARAHLHLGRLCYLLGEYALMAEHLHNSLQFAEASQNRELIVTVLDRLAWLAFEQSDFLAAGQWCARALSLLDEQSPARAPIYNTLGNIAKQKANWGDAIRYFKLALELREQQGDQRLCGDILHSLGNVQRLAGEYEAAQDNLIRSVQLLGDAGDFNQQARGRADLGILYWQTGRVPEAIACYGEAEQIATKNGDMLLLARICNNRGLALATLGDFATAEMQIQRSISLAEQIKHVYETANAKDSLALVLVKKGDLTGGLALWQEALEALQDLGDKPIRLITEITRHHSETLTMLHGVGANSM